MKLLIKCGLYLQIKGSVTHIDNRIMKKRSFRMHVQFHNIDILIHYISTDRTWKTSFVSNRRKLNVSIQSSKRIHAEVIFFVISFKC